MERRQYDVGDVFAQIVRAVNPRTDKSVAYAVEHVVLPHLLLHMPGTFQQLLQCCPEAFADRLWEAVAQSRGEPQAPVQPCRVSLLVQEQRGLALIVDFPVPTVMPEAFMAVMLLAPQRRYFVVEHTAEQISRKHRRAFSWVEPASPVATDPRRSLGWLCEWLPDGSRRNYQMVDYADTEDVMQHVNQWIGLSGTWDRVVEMAEACASLDLVHVPERMQEEPLDQALAGMIQSYIKKITSMVPTTLQGYHERALAIRRFIEEGVHAYGHGYTEITLHTMSAIELLLAAHATAEASALVIMWQNFCHRYRGNLAPETMLSHAAAALVSALDVDVADQRAGVEHWMRFRDTFKPRMQRNLPGADHWLLTATAEEFASSSHGLWHMATDHS